MNNILDPEIIEYNSLCQVYNHAKDLRSQIISQVRFCSKRIETARREIQELEKRTDEFHNARYFIFINLYIILQV